MARREHVISLEFSVIYSWPSFHEEDVYGLSAQAGAIGHGNPLQSFIIYQGWPQSVKKWNILSSQIITEKCQLC